MPNSEFKISVRIFVFVVCLINIIFVHKGKTETADLTTNYDAETNTSLAEKIKNVREHNFEGGANNSEMDKDTARNNLNNKVEYLSLALPLNILFLLFVFIGFSTCKVRFGISTQSLLLLYKRS